MWCLMWRSAPYSAIDSYHKLLNQKRVDMTDVLCAPTHHGERLDANRSAFKQFYLRFLADDVVVYPPPNRPVTTLAARRLP